MGWGAFWGVEWVEDLRSFCAAAIVSLAALHVVAALFESVFHRENLVGAMVTGRKRAPSEADVDDAHSAGRG